MSHYTRQFRAERLNNAAEKTARAADAAFNAARGAVGGIPFGQPILVGHHSEARHRNALKRHDNAMRKGCDLAEKARDLKMRAIGSENNTAIYSDDPDAIASVEAKIAEIETERAKYVAINKLVRKKDRAGLHALGYTDKLADALFEPDCMGNIGIPAYILSNLSGNLRRYKLRLEELKAKTTAEGAEYTLGGVRVVENVEIDRLQIFFDGKPEADMRTKLKAHGFRWAPSEGAWQRNLSNGARWAAKYVLGETA